MSRITRSSRRWFAIAIWLGGILLFLALAGWNVQSSREDAENRLIGEAGRAAAQISAILSLPGLHLDAPALRAIVLAAMEDESIYALRVRAGKITEGIRRNYLWEPVEWDDEIAENSVQGLNPLRLNGNAVGRVEVWLSPRLMGEENSLLERRELWRFVLAAALWTSVLLLLLWQWGDIRHWRNSLAASRQREKNPDKAEKIVLGLGKTDGQSPKPDPVSGPSLVDSVKGRKFQNGNPDAWFVTAGMFRQTFSRAPALLGRLYAEGETAGLCHLGRMLELAAPCIGAEPLVQAARAMQKALNDPECATRAAPVENCARILEETLSALGAGPLKEPPPATNA